MYLAGEAQIVSRQFLEEQYLIGFIVYQGASSQQIG
jgi:hypothetical protein